MVTGTEAGPVIEAPPVALERTSEKVCGPSTWVSSKIWKVKDLVVSPSAKVKTPLVLAYLRPAMALPGPVLKLTETTPEEPLVRRIVTGRKPAPSLTT